MNIILGPIVTGCLDCWSCPCWIITCWSWLVVLPWNFTGGVCIVIAFVFMIFLWPLVLCLSAFWHYFIVS